jgi:putative ABC transport system permease protein
MIWYKVWYDLWRHKARTLLAVLSIAAGIFAIGGIFGLVDQLLATMDSAHRAVVPSHANIILRDFVTQDVVDDLKGLPGVVDIDPVNQISVRYRTSPDAAWTLGTLVQRPDFDDQTYDVIALREGSWPAEGAIGVERLSGQYFDVAIGDQVEFEIGGEATAFPVSGLIRHPFVQPPLFGGQAHFFADAAGLAEFGVPEGRFGQLLVRAEPYSLEQTQQVAGDIRDRLASQGYGVAVTLYQDPDLHWGRQFVEGINLILMIMAVVSLFLSVMLVLTTLTALITQQTDQIGVIKAIGGQRGVIVQMYLAVALIYGLLALLIAVPLGALFAYGMARWYLDLFNIDYTVFQVSSLAVAVQIGMAFAAPVVAALWPVLKGANISVREAIASYGLGGDFGFSRFDRFVDRIGERFFSAPVAAALGNMFRHKERLVLTVGVLVVAGVMFIVIMSLISSVTLTLDNEMARRDYDLRIGFTRAQEAEELLAIAEGIEGVESAQVWYSRNATILREGERLQDSAGLGAQLTGVPAGEARYTPIIVAGRWLEPGDGQVVVISQETAEANSIAVGDTITLDLGDLGDAAWEVVGAYRVVYGGGFVTEAIYAPLDAMAEATGQTGLGTQVLVQTAAQDLAQVTSVADDLKSAFETAGMTVDFYTTSIKLEERQFAANQFDTVVWMLLGLAMLVATVGGIGLMGSLGIGVVERTREIGVMRAIGAQSRTIMGLFMLEGVLQGLISWVLAVPIAFAVGGPLARLLGQTMIDVDLDYAFNLPAVFIWLATVLVIAALFSTGPARNATRISVRQSLAYA